MSVYNLSDVVRLDNTIPTINLNPIKHK